MPSKPLMIAMVAVFIGVMLLIKFYVAPAIVANYGFVGVLVWIGACLAAAKWLEN